MEQHSNGGGDETGVDTKFDPLQQQQNYHNLIAASAINFYQVRLFCIRE